MISRASANLLDPKASSLKYKAKAREENIKIMGWGSDCLVLDLAIVGAHVTINVVAIVALFPSGCLNVPISTVARIEVTIFQTIVSIVGRVFIQAILIAAVSILSASIITLLSIVVYSSITTLPQAILIAAVSIGSLSLPIVTLFPIVHFPIAAPACNKRDPLNFKGASILFDRKTSKGEQYNAISSVLLINQFYFMIRLGCQLL